MNKRYGPLPRTCPVNPALEALFSNSALSGATIRQPGYVIDFGMRLLRHPDLSMSSHTNSVWHAVLVQAGSVVLSDHERYKASSAILSNCTA